MIYSSGQSSSFAMSMKREHPEQLLVSLPRSLKNGEVLVKVSNRRMFEIKVTNFDDGQVRTIADIDHDEVNGDDSFVEKHTAETGQADGRDRKRRRRADKKL